jgi:hypothetical protein
MAETRPKDALPRRAPVRPQPRARVIVPNRGGSGKSPKAVSWRQKSTLKKT